MTHPLIMTPPYSMKIFEVRTFANCPKTVKFAKVFIRERFPLYGSEYSRSHFIQEKTFNQFRLRLIVVGIEYTADDFT